jgi:hypothetical protein
MKHRIQDYTLFDLLSASESIYQTEARKAEIDAELCRRFAILDEYHEYVRVHNLK